ncbi:tetratricopeptide repeat-containing protein [Streptosporangium sp. NPDC051022]|uniref:tetratricopeptide repeat-containing protein n=1 Tax=Streptosporangium sp. NPDC051022 TaxID=3155752 RepID=UPI00342E25D3
MLVLDNVIDADLVAVWLPAFGAAQVIISSNHRQAHSLGETVEVEVFTPQEAVAFLQQRSGRVDEAGALSLAEEVGRLPLALAQAAWLIRRQHLDYQTYLHRLRSLSLAEMLPPVPAEGYPHGAAQAVLLSLAQIGSGGRVRLERSLLEVLALLSPAGVPRSWLHRITAHPELAGKVKGDGATRVDAAIGVLADASLIVVSADGSSVGMHRFIQRVIGDSISGKSRLDSLLITMTGWLEQCGPPLERVILDRSDRDAFIDQAATLHRRAVKNGATADIEAIRKVLHLQERAGDYLQESGDLDRALALHERTLSDRARILGADHPDTLESSERTAFVYKDTGNFLQSTLLCKQTLDGRVRVLGPDHPLTLDSVGNLARSYELLGDLTRAIPLHERNLADSSRVLGTDHPATLTTRNNLANAYHLSGNLDRAISWYEQNLADSIRVLGAYHPDTLTGRNNLAHAYESAGDFARAIPLYERTLADRTRILGADHPYTLHSCNKLAHAYASAGDLARAIPLYEQTLNDCVRVLSASHPLIATVRDNLAAARGSH